MTRPPYRIDDRKAAAWAPVIGTQGAQRRLGRWYRNRPLQVYPGVLSTDRGYLRAMERLGAELNVSVHTDRTGVLGPDAIPGDFNQLRTVAGFGMSPVSVPPESNEPIRNGLKLLTEFASPRDKRIFAELVRLMFARSAPAKVPIRREASTGPPDFVNDVPKKKRELRAALTNIDRFLDLVHKGDLLTLYVEFNAPICSAIGIRTQADKVVDEGGSFTSRSREVNDELAARTSFKEGRRFAADKRIIVDGREIVGHFAGRRRTVFGAAFVANYVLAAACASWREVYLKDFAFTWKHRSKDEILEKLNRFDAFMGFDVKQFDQTVPDFLVEAMIEEMGNYNDERLCSLVRLLFKAPYIVPYPWNEGTSVEPFDPLFGDDPFDVGCFDKRVGLPSGISINPDTGKLLMVFQYLVVLDRYYGDVLEVGVDVILRGENPRYGMLNMGDDCVLMVDTPAFQEWFVAHWSEQNGAYFYLEEERPISFLGNVPYRDDKGELKIAPNVVSYLVNWLVPEHGIDSMARVNFWAVGERERRIHYAQAPRYPAVHEALERIIRDELGFSPQAIATEAFEQQRRYQNLTTWDALVLQNPSYLHYKVDESALSPEVLDLIVTSLAPDEVWPHMKHLFDPKYHWQ